MKSVCLLRGGGSWATPCFDILQIPPLSLINSSNINFCYYSDSRILIEIKLFFFCSWAAPCLYIYQISLLSLVNSCNINFWYYSDSRILTEIIFLFVFFLILGYPLPLLLANRPGHSDFTYLLGPLSSPCGLSFGGFGLGGLGLCGLGLCGLGVGARQLQPLAVSWLKIQVQNQKSANHCTRAPR
jgi:hypothetical protein